MNWNRFAPILPVGIEPEQEFKWVGLGWGAALLYSMGYLFQLRSGYDDLFVHQRGRVRTLMEGVIMPDFGALLGRGLIGFVIVFLCMVALAAYHYGYHHQGSQSIYLMRRLPDRWELHRRCLTLPLVCAALSLLLAGILLLAYYVLYLFVTPETCLMPGQWSRLWGYLIGG